MHRPFPITICATLAAALLLAPVPAAAKNLLAARVCGPDACREVPKEQLSIRLVEGGSRTLAPERAEPWYRVRVTVGAEGAGESWWLVVLPRGGFTGYAEDPGGYYQWGTISDSTAAAYRRIAGALRPFPASQLRLAREAHPDETAAAPSAAPADDDDAGGHGVAIAGALAGGVLLAALGASVWRRRRTA